MAARLLVVLTMLVGATAFVSPSQLTAYRSRQTKSVALQAVEKPDPLQAVKDAGIAGIASYFLVEVSFFAFALPTGYFLYHSSTQEWLNLTELLSEGEGRVKILSLLVGYIVVLKTAFPLRLGATLALTPKMKELLRRGGLANNETK